MSEKGTKRDGQGGKPRKNAPSKRDSQPAPAKHSCRHFCQDSFPLPPTPDTLPSSCPFLAWPAVEGWGTGGGEQRVRASW